MGHRAAMIYTSKKLQTVPLISDQYDHARPCGNLGNTCMRPFYCMYYPQNVINSKLRRVELPFVLFLLSTIGDI